MSRARSIVVALPHALRRGLPKLMRLRATEVLLLPHALIALPSLAFALRRWGLARVQELLLSQAAPRNLEGRAAQQAVERLSWTVQVAAAYGPWPANCLQRSVLLCWYLHRRGLRGDLRIGMRRTETSALDFHAWVEHDGVVVNDRRDVRERYVVFDRPIAPDVARFS